MRSVCLALFLTLTLLPAQTPWPGPQPDGTTLLPNGWSLRPTGRQIPLRADLPVRMVVHPGGRFLAVQHAGYRKHQIVVLDLKSEKIVAEIPLGKTWSGMAFSGDGSKLFASGGVEDVIHVFDFDGAKGGARRSASWKIGEDGVVDLPAGMAVGPKGKVFVVLQRSDQVLRLDAAGKSELRIALPEDSFPFECRLGSAGDLLWVSLWGRAEVRAFDARSGEERHRIAAGEHPSEMLLSPDGTRLFVSNGNENSVTVIDTARGRVEETLGSALFPLAPPGSTPNALALTPKGKLLMVANADNNNCAVIDVSTRGRSRSIGFIPLGAYPTSIRITPDGGRVIAANGKGSGGSRRNPGGPNPGAKAPTNLAEYTGAMFSGSLSIFEFPSPKQLQELSARAYACSPLRGSSAVRGLESRPQDSPIPARLGDASPIRHCVYIIKENRTYDQVFGDDPRGNGDSTLCLFPEKVTPNHHALSRDFVLLDNFYVEAEVSADGHEWTMGAYATDFVERTWPVIYGGKGSARQKDGTSKRLGYPSEGGYPVAFPKNRYLWDRAKAAGVSFRSYGEFVINGPTHQDPATTAVPTLQGHIDPLYRGYDLSYRDVDRAKRFLFELRRFEREGKMPRLIVMHLPNDHTSGTRVGRPTPRAQVADNDLALGMVLEGLSTSPFWKSMAVFVVEDDAQNGPDHVDAHRAVALLAGPYVKRGAVVSSMYSTCGMLRTIELILGLEPMSQFDAAARPMYDCFVAKPDLEPYTCRKSTWPLDEKNKETAWGAERSAGFDLSREDAADDIALNEVIWRSVKGADSPMPMPRRAAFVRIVDED